MEMLNKVKKYCNDAKTDSAFQSAISTNYKRWINNITNVLRWEPQSTEIRSKKEEWQRIDHIIRHGGLVKIINDGLCN